MCAKVRVKIVQELVLTRDAFNARLEIENGESSPLQNIRVEIEIRETYGSNDFVADRFAIGSFRIWYKMHSMLATKTHINTHFEYIILKHVCMLDNG